MAAATLAAVVSATTRVSALTARLSGHAAVSIRATQAAGAKRHPPLGARSPTRSGTPMGSCNMFDLRILQRAVNRRVTSSCPLNPWGYCEDGNHSLKGHLGEK